LFSVAGLSIVEQEILRYMSLIDYGGVAIDKFKDWVGLEDYNFLNSLIDGGWIISSNKGDDEIIFMHPVISDAVFEQTKPNSENCKKLLEGIYEKEKDYRYLYQKRYLINILRFIINRIGKEETKEIADIYHILARITSTIDVNYNNCIENLKQAQKIYLKVLGEEHPDTAMSYNDIGFVYNLKDEYNQALEYYIKALNIREKILGKHQDTALSYNNIGSIYNAKSEYDKALEYHFKALEIRKKVLGEECSDTAISYNNIGLTYTNKGEYDNALEYLFKALNIREKVLEEEHPNIANSYNNIGFVYKNKGEYDIALDYYFKALEIKENVFGEKHPSTILTYKNIVVCYLAMGDEENASKYAKLAGLIE
jgi:tetratricopeptide (TPR) repeat protein